MAPSLAKTALHILGFFKVAMPALRIKQSEKRPAVLETSRFPEIWQVFSICLFSSAWLGCL